MPWEKGPEACACFGGDRFIQNILYHSLKWWLCIPFLQRSLHIIVRRKIGTQSVLWSHYAVILPISNMLLAICVRRSKCKKSVRRGRTRSRVVPDYRRIHSREKMPACVYFFALVDYAGRATWSPCKCTHFDPDSNTSRHVWLVKSTCMSRQVLRNVLEVF